MFVRSGTVGNIVVIIYVDDLTIAGDNADKISTLKHSLQHKFAIKDLGMRLLYQTKLALGIKLDWFRID